MICGEREDSAIFLWTDALHCHPTVLGIVCLSSHPLLPRFLLSQTPLLWCFTATKGPLNYFVLCFISTKTVKNSFLTLETVLVIWLRKRIWTAQKNYHFILMHCFHFLAHFHAQSFLTKEICLHKKKLQFFSFQIGIFGHCCP